MKFVTDWKSIFIIQKYKFLKLWYVNLKWKLEHVRRHSLETEETEHQAENE